MAANIAKLPELLARRLRLLKIALCHASSLKDQVGAVADQRSLTSLVEKLLVEHLKKKGYLKG